MKAAANLKGMGYRFHLLFAGRETNRLKPLAAELGIGDIVTYHCIDVILNELSRQLTSL